MALRLIEMIIPTRDPEEVSGFLEHEDTLGTWIERISEEEVRARVLVRSTHTERVSDTISRTFGARDGFRLILFAVEATSPPVDEAAPATPTEPGTDKPRDDIKTPLRVSREELYNDVADGAELSMVYVVTVVLSTVVCAIGLIRANVAVVVGAMVIAPLLGPIVALALGSTLGDVPLVTRSLRTAGAGMATAIFVSLLVGALVELDPTNVEILSRTHVGLSDVVLALAAGSAGALAYTSGISASLVGVMVAVALLPPLVTAGLLAGSGQEARAVGAAVLVVTNVACINLSGVSTFLAQRVRPRTWWEEKKAKRATRRAVLIWLCILIVLLLVILRGWGIEAI
ncbi:MAG: TIGR00341 family protein [bacterium]